MNRNLNKKEQEWLNKMLGERFKGNQILRDQVSECTVTSEKDFSFQSIKFIINKNNQKFPFKIRVPVEMRAFQEKSAPIVFLLHVVDGFIDELEILTADSSEININSISIQKLEFEINKQLL